MNTLNPKKMSTTLSAIDQKTKAAETRSNMLAPKLRFKEFDGQWCLNQLDSVVGQKISYGIVQAGEHIENGMPYIKSQNLNFELNLSELQRTSEEIAKKYHRSEVKSGDIVFSLRGNIGVCRIVPPSIKVANLTQGTARISVLNEFNNRFIYLSMQCRRTVKQILEVSKGSTFQEISLEALRKVKIAIPTLPEQQKIASFLSAVDEKIQQLTRKKELLEQYKKGVMQNLFSGILRFKDENGGDFPDWEMVGGNKLFDSISDKKHNSDLPILAITQDQGAIPRDLINYQMSVTDSSIASYKVVQVGDFIISLRTFQGGIEYSNYKGICSPAYNILRPNSENVHRDFYRYYLKTEYYIKQLQKNLEGIRDGKMIGYKYFSEIKLPYPSVKEQQKIASYLSAIDTKIESVANQITQIQTFKKGLLQQMFV